MDSREISCSNAIFKHIIESWGKDKGFDAKDAIAKHLEEIFKIKNSHIIEVKDEGDQLILRIKTSAWKVPREFALLCSNSLIW